MADDPINGMVAYRPSNAPPLLLYTYQAQLFGFDGSNCFVIGPIPASKLEPVTMVQARDVVYGTDGVQMFQYDGTAAGPFTLNDAGGNPITHVSDLLYFLNRLWLASGDFLYFTDPVGVNFNTGNGRVSTIAGNITVTGNGTNFFADAQVGGYIQVDGEPTPHKITVINSATSLDVDAGFTNTLTNATWSFAVTLSPVFVSQLPLHILGGSGDIIGRLLDYRDEQILVFKVSDSGAGSVHIVSAPGNDPGSFSVFPVIQNFPIYAPRTVIRAGNNSSNDVFFFSKDGFRSLNITALDKITQPTLPFSVNISNYFNRIHWEFLRRSFTVIWEDELLDFVALFQYERPNWVLAYKLTPDKNTLYNGWSAIDMMPASSAASIGFNGEKPKLYLGGNSGGILYQAFAQRSNTRYLEISKRIAFAGDTYDFTNHKKTPFKLYVNYDVGSRGTITVSLIYEDGTEYVIGNDTVNVGGIPIPFILPAVIPAGAIPTPFIIDLHHDVTGVILPDFYDVRVQIKSNDFPRLLGFELLAKVKPYRYLDETRVEIISSRSGPLFQETVLAGTVEAS